MKAKLRYAYLFISIFILFLLFWNFFPDEPSVADVVVDRKQTRLTKSDETHFHQTEEPTENRRLLKKFDLTEDNFRKKYASETSYLNRLQYDNSNEMVETFDGQPNPKFPYFNIDESQRSSSSSSGPNSNHNNRQFPLTFGRCTMSNCFNFTRCPDFNGDSSTGPTFPLKIHIYPDIQGQMSFVDGGEQAPRVSEVYFKFITSLRQSVHYTADPAEACLFVLAYDTSDRDPKSFNYVKNLPSRIKNLPADIWDEGRNHVIINMYPGTYPDYDLLDFQFDPGMAIIAKASFSRIQFRSNFDISLPLFHKDHPLRTSTSPNSYSSSNPTTTFKAQSSPDLRQYLVTFKGKRYTYGLGSETRNSLYHLHNDGDVIMLTTCKHGRDWDKMQDERCAGDNLLYDKYEYNELMGNSTFCLVPRGRRPGSFRFLEALEAGCIPVILSDDWVLPFSSVIDWSAGEAAVLAHERLISQVPEVLREIPKMQVIKMRTKSREIYRKYFSSVENIIFTTVQIIQDRLNQYHSRSRHDWNSRNINGLYHSPAISESSKPTPPSNIPIQNPTLTLLITVMQTDRVPLIRRLESYVTKCRYCTQIYVLWLNTKLKPPREIVIPIKSSSPTDDNERQLRQRFAIRVIDGRPKTKDSHRHDHQSDLTTPFKIIPNVLPATKTDGIFLIDDSQDTLLNYQQVTANVCQLRLYKKIYLVNFGIEVWRWFPMRLIGYKSASHYWDTYRREWRYTSKRLSYYSMIHGSAAISHSWYFDYFSSHWIKSPQQHVIDQAPLCTDILFNFMISQISNRPPIKLPHQRKPDSINDNNVGNVKGAAAAADTFRQRQDCFGILVSLQGRQILDQPLHRSWVQADPLLFKDPVSVERKQFILIETPADGA